MDPELFAASKVTGKTIRKVRFAPKDPPRKAQTLVVPKPEIVEDDFDAVKSEELLRRFNEVTVRKAKVEKKGSIQFVPAPGGFLKSLKSNLSPNDANKLKNSASNDGGTDVLQPEKEYNEPWDYYTYYPTTLPLRRPYLGNPEVLDKKEFGETLQRSVYNECLTNSAAELGLLEDALEGNMFFQLPLNWHMLKKPENAQGSETANNNPKAPPKARLCKLDELGEGFLGKIVVYRNGAVKMKLGETLYDVSPGMDCVFAQGVVAVNTEEKACCDVGELNKRAVLTLDIHSVLGSMPDS